MADSAVPSLYKATITLNRSQRLKLYLKDYADRENKHPPEFILTAIPNRPPSVRMNFPSRDVEVSPLEELQLTARVSDDFRLVRYGIRYQVGGAEETEVVLGKSGAPSEKITASHLLAFEDLNAEPDQLLSYYAFAEDRYFDQSRRVTTQLRFIDVRPVKRSFEVTEASGGT